MTLIGAINFGCPKNLVDLELMLGMVSEAGYKVTLDTEGADVVIVNTCSFILDAQKESIHYILELVEINKPLIVTGCLAQKYQQELQEQIPEIFAFLGTADITKIVDVIKDFEQKQIKKIYHVTPNPVIFYPENVKRQQITVGSASYLKIAEGCNYKCGYCIIPALKGPYRSRNMGDVIKEAKQLVDKGVNEIILIAQDTSYYGYDKFGAPVLASLLEKLNDIQGLGWIRVMYTYPSMINDELIDAVANLPKVVKYFDIPLQHSHPEVLKKMLRPVIDYRELLAKIRSKIDGVAVRTALITGYPTETEEQFEHLHQFVKDMRFDKLGVFEYSREKGTYSYDLKPQIPAKIKKERKKIIMKTQSRISYEINQGFIGKQIPVIIEQIASNGEITARSYRDAPEVDGLVYIKSDKPLLPADIELCTITGADEYDLIGEI
ncbi:MAG: 30S ribosomal protein S12 methylthiotransferase RimO [Candidatus Gastranaerophilales bacterium]|nr:30S ribosomal protein S12 methylthiotransferase RimO [Candidatus Gastranaerophilales bacterium]